MKYMLLIFGNEKAYDEMDTWPEKDLAAMRDFMGRLNDDLIASGEFVQGYGLAHPGLGRTVRATAEGLPAVTDGPYSEGKEVLAGFWILDLESIDRATEIAARISTSPNGPGDTEPFPVEIRPVTGGSGAEM
ncbi:YciI family protein [Streptomyces sp. NPDC059373]